MDSELSNIMLNQTIEKYHKALNEFVQGKATPILEIFSKQEDVCLADPISPAVRGYQQVVSTAVNSASNYHDGKTIGFDNMVKVVTSDLAFIVEIEHYSAKVADRQETIPLHLRVTSIFRMETGGWKLLHRHADPIVSELAPETMLQKQAI